MAQTIKNLSEMQERVYLLVSARWACGPPMACARMLSLSVVSDCDPMEYSPPGSSVHGIFPASILEWVAIPSSRRSS